MSFNKDEYIKQMKLREKLNELSEKKADIKRKCNSAYENEDYKQEIQKNQMYIAEYKGIKKLFKLKKIKEYQNEIKQLEATEEKEHNEYILNQKKYKEELTSIESEISNIQSQFDDNFVEGLYLDDSGILTISDKADIKLSNHPNDEIMLVHSTDFFPKNKTILNRYDGNKMIEGEVTYSNITKKVKRLGHRHTVHFVQNGVVRSTADGAGVWEQMKFIVFEPMKKHQDQIIDNEEPGDTYTYGSVKLSDKPILLVRKDAYNEIPPEEINNYEIIKYDGDFVKCGENMLHVMGLYHKGLNPQNSVHANSIEAYTEKKLDDRDKCINYMKDDSYDGKSSLILSGNELCKLRDIYNDVMGLYVGKKNHKYCRDCVVNVEDAISKKINIPFLFVVFMIQNGIILDSNKNFTLKNDEEMYKSFKQLEQISKGMTTEKLIENFDKIENIVDVENIAKAYEEYAVARYDYDEEENKSKIELTGKDIIDFPINELHLFKNIDKAKVVNKIFKEIDERYKKESNLKFNSSILYSENGMEMTCFSEKFFSNGFLSGITFSLKGDTVREAIANYEYSIRNIDKIIEEQQTINMPEEIESSGIRM